MAAPLDPPAVYVAIVPRPKLVRAVAASDAPVPPCATATSVAAQVPVPIVPTVVIESSPVYVLPATAASVALYACTSVPIASPKFVLAVPASDAPVPPCVTAISVAAQVPVPIVPTLVKLDPVTLEDSVDPVNVEAAVVPLNDEPVTVPVALIAAVVSISVLTVPLDKYVATSLLAYPAGKPVSCDPSPMI